MESCCHWLTELAEVYARHAGRHGPNRLLPAGGASRSRTRAKARRTLPARRCSRRAHGGALHAEGSAHDLIDMEKEYTMAHEVTVRVQQ